VFAGLAGRDGALVVQLGNLLAVDPPADLRAVLRIAVEVHVGIGDLEGGGARGRVVVVTDRSEDALAWPKAAGVCGIVPAHRPGRRRWFPSGVAEDTVDIDRAFTALGDNIEPTVAVEVDEAGAVRTLPPMWMGEPSSCLPWRSMR